MKNQGLAKPGIVQWVSNHSGLSTLARQRIIEDNEQAVANVRWLNLPMDRDFGSFNDLESMSRAIPEECKQNSLFIIRCPLRTGKAVERDLFVTWDGVIQFVDNLPGGYEQYRLGLREVSVPLWSGTIISSMGGESVKIELWQGKHLAMDEGGAATSFRGTYDRAPGNPLVFVWSEGCTNAMKDMMLRALKYFALHLNPRESFIAEFSVTARGHRFNSVSFDPYWTERSVTWSLKVSGD